MVVFDNTSHYLLAQNYAQYDVDTDIWSYPATIQLPLPATSYIDDNSLPWHSEVASAYNGSTPDDIYAVASANDSIIGRYLWYGRYYPVIDPWSTSVNVGTGWYAPALGKRNTLDYLTVTAIEIVQATQLYSADYDMIAHTWGTLTAIDGVDATSEDSVQTDYDNGNSSYLGALYYDNTVAFIPDMEFGCYGCSEAPTPSTIPAAVTTMAWIVILVFGALICIILIGYGAYESSRGRTSELAKVGAAGLIGLIIAAIIVTELL